MRLRSNAQSGGGSGTPVRPARSTLDRVWDFFSSVRVATVLIFVIAAAAVIGSLIPQEGQYGSWLPPAQFYPQNYGPFWGHWLFRLGVTRLYTTWWFVGLLGMLGLSLIICTWHRLVPLHRALNRPRVRHSAAWVRAKAIHHCLPPGDGATLAAAATELRRRGFAVQREDNCLYADKGRWSRWGPYITHIGLLLVLLGAMARAVPGWYQDATIWIPDGETVLVPGTDWAVRNEAFTAAFHPDGRPRSFETAAVVIDGGREVRHQTIRVNQPLVYKNVKLYQLNYRTVPGTATLALGGGDGGQEIGRFAVDLQHPAREYAAGDSRVNVAAYFPDFALDPDQQPITLSPDPRNPAFVFVISRPGARPVYQWFFLNYPELQTAGGQTAYRLWPTAVTARSTTGLRVKKDPGVPAVYLGLAVTTIGLMLSFYVAHRIIWVVAEDGGLVLGASSRRFRRELEREVIAVVAAIAQPARPGIAGAVQEVSL